MNNIKVGAVFLTDTLKNSKINGLNNRSKFLCCNGRWLWVTVFRRVCVYLLSVAEDRLEEKAWDVLFLAFKNDGTILSGLGFPSHQVEELIETHQVIVKRLRLKVGSDTSSARWPSTQLACVGRVVLSIAIEKFIPFALCFILLSVYRCHWINCLHYIFIG